MRSARFTMTSNLILYDRRMPSTKLHRMHAVPGNFARNIIITPCGKGVNSRERYFSRDLAYPDGGCAIHYYRDASNIPISRPCLGSCAYTIRDRSGPICPLTIEWRYTMRGDPCRRDHRIGHGHRTTVNNTATPPATPRQRHLQRYGNVTATLRQRPQRQRQRQTQTQKIHTPTGTGIRIPAASQKARAWRVCKIHVMKKQVGGRRTRTVVELVKVSRQRNSRIRSPPALVALLL